MISDINDEISVGDKKITLEFADITERKVDAIVNTANSALNHGGGVALAIVRKGGWEIQIESYKLGYVPVGSSVVTGAGKLPCKVVIHTVGPQMGEGDEDNKLKMAMQGVLQLADQKGFKSISVPAISSGIYEFPKDRCAQILIGETVKFLQSRQASIELVEFCIIDKETLAHFRNAFKKQKMELLGK